MTFALALVAGVIVGAAVAGAWQASNSCCALVQTGVRAKFPASLQTVGDALHVWPATIGLAHFG